MERVLPDNPFKGSLAAEYDLLRLMCPNSIKLAAMIGDKISHIFTDPKPVKGFENRLTAFVLFNMQHTKMNLIELAEPSDI